MKSMISNNVLCEYYNKLQQVISCIDKNNILEVIFRMNSYAIILFYHASYQECIHNIQQANEYYLQYDITIIIDRQYIYIQLLLAIALYRCGKLQQAEDLLNTISNDVCQIKACNDLQVIILSNLSFIQMILQKYELALKTAQDTMKLIENLEMNNSSQALHLTRMLILVYVKMSKFENAETTILESNLQDIEKDLFLSGCKFAQGHIHDAQIILEQAISEQSYNSQSQIHLAQMKYNHAYISLVDMKSSYSSHDKRNTNELTKMIYSMNQFLLEIHHVHKSFIDDNPLNFFNYNPMKESKELQSIEDSFLIHIITIQLVFCQINHILRSIYDLSLSWKMDINCSRKINTNQYSDWLEEEKVTLMELIDNAKSLLDISSFAENQGISSKYFNKQSNDKMNYQDTKHPSSEPLANEYMIPSTVENKTIPSLGGSIKIYDLPILTNILQEFSYLIDLFTQEYSISSIQQLNYQQYCYYTNIKSSFASMSNGNGNGNGNDIGNGNGNGIGNGNSNGNGNGNGIGNGNISTTSSIREPFNLCNELQPLARTVNGWNELTGNILWILSTIDSFSFGSFGLTICTFNTIDHLLLQLEAIQSKTKPINTNGSLGSSLENSLYNIKTKETKQEFLEDLLQKLQDLSKKYHQIPFMTRGYSNSTSITSTNSNKPGTMNRNKSSKNQSIQSNQGGNENTTSNNHIYQQVILHILMFKIAFLLNNQSSMESISLLLSSFIQKLQYLISSTTGSNSHDVTNTCYSFIAIILRLQLEYHQYYLIEDEQDNIFQFYCYTILPLVKEYYHISLKVNKTLQRDSLKKLINCYINIANIDFPINDEDNKEDDKEDYQQVQVQINKCKPLQYYIHRLQKLSFEEIEMNEQSLRWLHQFAKARAKQLMNQLKYIE